jgi:integration host factor subunit alpha
VVDSHQNFLTLQTLACINYLIHQHGNLLEGGLMPSTLTKADVISLIQTENGYSRRKSTDIVETLLEIIKRALESVDDVLISEFGKFQVKGKREHRGRNPAKDEDMILPARGVLRSSALGG